MTAQTHYVEALPDGRPGVVYRMAADGSTAERYDWKSKGWVEDDAVVRKLVDGADLAKVTPAAATKAIAKREVKDS